MTGLSTAVRHRARPHPPRSSRSASIVARTCGSGVSVGRFKGTNAHDSANQRKAATRGTPTGDFWTIGDAWIEVERKARRPEWT
jgi:hypothetical protein